MMKKLYLLNFTMIMFLCAQTSITKGPDSLKFPLPRHLEPLHYDIEIFTDLNRKEPIFWGKVRIKVKCKESTDRIILHQVKLEIKKKIENIKQLPIVSDSPSTIPVKKHDGAPESNQYVIILEKSMEKNINYEIKIEFSGKFSTAATGYALLIHDRTENSRRRIAYTRMEEVGARRMFPCFDEMDMKATFTVRIGRPVDMKGLSTANFSFTEPATFPRDWVIDEFKETVSMEASALATALLLPVFESSLLRHVDSNTDIRTLADSSYLNQLGYFSLIVVRIFHFYWNYFKVDYAFEKLDVLVLLKDDKATSSYGVIYTSERLILDALKNLSSFTGYEMVAEVCLVISKQWIGYMATMSKHDENYLHTALNQFLQTMCVAEIGSWLNNKWAVMYLESSVLVTFINLHQLLLTDNSKQPILSTTEGSRFVLHFGNQELDKALNLFRMIHDILGDDVFQKSIINYLNQFKFRNSNKNELWDAFTNTANDIRPDLLAKHNLSIRGIADSWINQTGYPLITVSWNDDTKEIHISQEPIYSLGEEKQDRLEKCWIIPLSYATKSESKSTEFAIRNWLTCEGPLVISIDIPPDNWILFDLSSNGRINYDESNWTLIVKSLVSMEDPHVFDNLTRARLMSDIFALAEIGELSYKIVLDAIKYLPRESCSEVLVLVLYEINRIRSRLIGTRINKSFQKHVRKVLKPVFSQEQFKNVAEFPTEMNWGLKIAVIDSSCMFGVKACRQQGQKISKQWSKDGIWLEFPGILNGTLHCQGVKNGNGNYWNFAWNYFKESAVTYKHPVKQMLRALACTTSKSILKRYLKYSITEEILANDVACIFQSVLSNRKGYNLMKTFLNDHYNDILKSDKRQTIIHIYWKELLDATVKREDLEELEKLARIQDLDLSNSSDFVYASYMNAQNNVSWYERNKETFNEYFSYKGIFRKR